MNNTTELEQLTDEEVATLRTEMRSEQGAATALAKNIGIGRARLYSAVNGDTLGYAALDKIRKYLASKTGKAA